MKQVLDDILLAEKQANQIIGQVRQDASKMRRDAEISISKEKAELKEQARELVQNAVEKAKRDFENEAQNLDDGSDCSVDTKNRNIALESIVRLICEPFSEKEE